MRKRRARCKCLLFLLGNIVLILWLQRVLALNDRSLMIEFRVYMRLLVHAERASRSTVGYTTTASGSTPRLIKHHQLCFTFRRRYRSFLVVYILVVLASRCSIVGYDFFSLLGILTYTPSSSLSKQLSFRTASPSMV